MSYKRKIEFSKIQFPDLVLKFIIPDDNWHYFFVQ